MMERLVRSESKRCFGWKAKKKENARERSRQRVVADFRAPNIYPPHLEEGFLSS
jgi:hypothetical protein